MEGVRRRFSERILGEIYRGISKRNFGGNSRIMSNNPNNNLLEETLVKYLKKILEDLSFFQGILNF